MKIISKIVCNNPIHVPFCQRPSPLHSMTDDDAFP